jgi:hypothetical protein
MNEIFIPLDAIELATNTFIEFCARGHLDYLRYCLTPSYIYNNINLGFKVACRNGKLNIAKYFVNLYKKQNAKFKIECSYGIICACKKGHSNIIKYLFWLYKKDNIDYDNIINGYIKARRINCIDIIKYLLSTGYYKPVDIDICNKNELMIFL